MIQIHGYWWPDDVGSKWEHSLRHVQSLEWAIAACPERRVAIQAGGNIGLWPKRLAESFEQVLTFEPEPISRACLERNVYKNVLVSAAALGDRLGYCSIDRKSLGSHKVKDGEDVEVVTIDSLDLEYLDLLQLDVEGYEWHALMGGLETIDRCQPVIQVELRGFTDHYGHTDRQVRELLASLGYKLATQRPGSDFVFTPIRRSAA
jgi:FkbM family methyltransferase